MAWRRPLLIAATAAMVCGAALPVLAQTSLWPAPGPPVPHRAVHPAVSPPSSALPGTYMSTSQLTALQLAACERRLERARQADGRHVPTVAIVGASITAGVGPGQPDGSWAALLARQFGWDAVVYGDPGAGYVRPGVHRRGPVAREIAQIGLPGLDPELVIVQAGHNDMGVPADLEQQRVKQAIAQIRAAAPRAGIALITVFAGRLRRPAAYQTDHSIVQAALAADPAVIIMDPLAAGWKYQRVRDGLHPTAAGSAWIAGQVARILQAHGVRPAPAPPGGGAAPRNSIICDFGIQAAPPTQAPPVLR